MYSGLSRLFPMQSGVCKKNFWVLHHGHDDLHVLRVGQVDLCVLNHGHDRPSGHWRSSYFSAHVKKNLRHVIHLQEGLFGTIQGLGRPQQGVSHLEVPGDRRGQTIPSLWLVVGVSTFEFRASSCFISVSGTGNFSQFGDFKGRIVIVDFSPEQQS